MSKAKKIFTNFRVLLLLSLIVLAVVAMSPNPWVKGVAIRSVEINSSASLAGIESPSPTSSPRSKERVIAINNQPVEDVEDYHNVVDSLSSNRTVTVKTNEDTYLVETRPLYDVEVLGEKVEKTVKDTILVNETINGSVVQVEKEVNRTILVNKTIKTEIGTEDIGLIVYEAPTTNIRQGLDLQGGTRVMLKPEEEVSSDVMEITIANMKERLNVYGISDVIVRQANDLSGNQYILVEVAGMTEDEVRDLLAQQGKFEAKIGEEVVFSGGDKDITYVCRSADCSGIDPTTGCSKVQGGGYACRFRFSISLRPEAANKQAEITKDLEIVMGENGQEYLSKDLELFLDDANVDTLKIGADLKGRPVTDISISGSGVGQTKQEAMYNSLDEMKRLQTLMITGSLPVQLEIVKVDVISPALGNEFIEESLLVGLLALLAIITIISLKYRTPKVVLPMSIITISEAILILGVASIIGWEMDLAAIAGILIAVGTGIDHQIIIADETLKEEHSKSYDWKTKIKRAFFILIGAYLTTVVAMLPLLSAGAGLLKGFALTTIIGTSIGILISRPAYSRVIEILLKD
jgi:preprotein translocase subunit SecD